MLGSKQRVIGGGKDDGEVSFDLPEDFEYKAILTRTNITAMDHIMTELAKGRKVGLPPKMRDDLLSLARTAQHMKGETWREPTEKHGDLVEYDNWQDVVMEAAGENGDMTAKKIVNLFDFERDIYKNLGITNIGEMIPHLQRLIDPEDTSEFTDASVGEDGRIQWPDRNKSWDFMTAVLAKHWNMSPADVDSKRKGSYNDKKQAREALASLGLTNRKVDNAWHTFVAGPNEDVRALKLQSLKDMAFSEPQTPDVTISTAHKSKGLEWESVLIADDFALKKDKRSGDPIPPEPESPSGASGSSKWWPTSGSPPFSSV